MSRHVTDRRRLSLVPGRLPSSPVSPLPGSLRARPGVSANRAARWPLALAGAGLALTMAGCGGQAAAVALPQKGDQATAASGAVTRPLTASQQVAAAYAGYWQAYAAAMTSQSPVRARAILAPYDPASQIPQQIRSLKRVWAAHDIAYGGAVPHILSIRVTGSSALLHDCLDLSHFGVEDTQTSQVVAGSFGQPRLNVYVTLMLAGGRWRVSNMQPVEVPCAP